MQGSAESLSATNGKFRKMIMTKKELMRKIALLESINDQLSTEVCNVDLLMRMVGFSSGLETVKATAHEMIAKGLVPFMHEEDIC